MEEDLFDPSPTWENRSRCLSESPRFVPSLRGHQGAPMDLEALCEEVLRRKRPQVCLIKEVHRVCCGLCIPLGESRFGGPSSNVGGDRKALVSDAGRPRGEGPYGDLSPGCEGGSEC